MNTIKALAFSLMLAAAPVASAADAFAPATDNSRIEVSQAPIVKVINGHVEINLPGEESKQVVVYALTGQVVKSVNVQPGVTVIDLPAGYYIVKCERLSQRVIIR